MNTPMMAALLLLLAVMVVQQGTAAPAPAPKTYKVAWAVQAKPYAELKVCKKDKVVFSWDRAFHNLVSSKSTAADICTKPDKTILAIRNKGSYTLDTTALKPGKYGYICTFSTHCKSGNQHIVINVQNCASGR